jgi:hypothetical protein
LAVACHHRVRFGGATCRVDELLAKVLARAWQRVSASKGAPGHRYCDWAFVRLDHDGPAPVEQAGRPPRSCAWTAAPGTLRSLAQAVAQGLGKAPECRVHTPNEFRVFRLVRGAVTEHADPFLSPPTRLDHSTKDRCGRSTQNSLPSGSARTTQDTSPWPMSTRRAPSAMTLSTSAA